MRVLMYEVEGKRVETEVTRKVHSRYYSFSNLWSPTTQAPPHVRYVDITGSPATGSVSTIAARKTSTLVPIACVLQWGLRSMEVWQ